MSTIVEARPTSTYSTPSLPKADPCILVIFGGTGDLTRRKLIPALYDLDCVGCMAPHFDILGLGRKDITDNDFRKSLEDAAAHSKDARDFTLEHWREFAKRISYLCADSGDPESYRKIAERLAEMQRNGASPNILFYLSTPSSVFAEIVNGIGDVGLNRNQK